MINHTCLIFPGRIPTPSRLDTSEGLARVAEEALAETIGTAAADVAATIATAVRALPCERNPRDRWRPILAMPNIKQLLLWAL
jgi:hypothetical protein